MGSITAIITGATSGIGAETARVLAKQGARLVLPARSLKAAEKAKARILAEFPNSDVLVMALDLSSLDSVRCLVSEFESLDLPLNLLINNAGKFTHEHSISEDGIEMTFATNYLVKSHVSPSLKEAPVEGGIMNIENIPAELMLDIFSRLPIRSLCLIKCVCKTWCDLIRDPRLPHLHLAQSEEEAFLLSHWFDMKRYRTTVFMAEHYSSAKPIFHFPGHCQVLHSFDGLLCAYDCLFRKAFVANPFTGEHLTLPPSREKILWPSVKCHTIGHYGLGFDSSIRKYKVVCAYFGEIDTANKRYQAGAQVYTIGTTASSSSRSSWRDIMSLPTVPIHTLKNSVYASGARHWMVDYRLAASDTNTMVISFNFEKEEFMTIPCLEFLFRGAGELIDLRGYLGLVHWAWGCIQIWKLKDYQRNQWVQEYCIDWYPSIDMVGQMGEDEIVLLRYYEAHDADAAVFAGDAGDTRDATVFGVDVGNAAAFAEDAAAFAGDAGDAAVFDGDAADAAVIAVGAAAFDGDAAGDGGDAAVFEGDAAVIAVGAAAFDGDAAGDGGDAVAFEGDAVVIAVGAAAFDGDAAGDGGDAAAFEGDAAPYAGDAAAFEGDAAAYAGHAIDDGDDDFAPDPEFAAYAAANYEDTAVFDGDAAGTRAVLLAYNPKSITLRNIHRFNNVGNAGFLLHRGTLASVSTQFF